MHFMILGYGFIKLSIAFFYRRLFVIARGTWFDWATKISITVVILWTISFFFGFMFSCGTHFSAAWGSLEDDAKYCGAALNLDNAFVVSDLITDIMILCLPLPVVCSHHRSWEIQTPLTIIDLESPYDKRAKTHGDRYSRYWCCVSSMHEWLQVNNVTKISLARLLQPSSKLLFLSRLQTVA